VILPPRTLETITETNMATAIEQPQNDVSGNMNPEIATLVRGAIRRNFPVPNEMTRWQVTSFKGWSARPPLTRS
jgi:hypothetical protein